MVFLIFGYSSYKLRCLDCRKVNDTIYSDHEVFVKSLFIHDKWDNCVECEENNGTNLDYSTRHLYAGLSCGQIRRWSLGQWI